MTPKLNQFGVMRRLDSLRYYLMRRSRAPGVKIFSFAVCAKDQREGDRWSLKRAGGETPFANFVDRKLLIPRFAKSLPSTSIAQLYWSLVRRRHATLHLRFTHRY
jgi:hypothetical protein